MLEKWASEGANRAVWSGSPHKDLVFISTTDVLPRGWGDAEPQPSELPLPAEGYAVSKLVGERLVEEGSVYR